MAKELTLSASRIKTAENCSWLYYCNYLLKLPQASNDGANRGSVVHVILECLAKPRRAEYVVKLLEDIKCIKSINKLMLKLARSHEVADETNVDLMYKFLHTGLNADFHYVKGVYTGVSMQEAEYAFSIGDPEKDGYKAIGFIDKHAIFEKDKIVRIGDYKSSKAKFNSKELADNVQAMMYSLVMLKKYPDYQSIVDFIFLKFPKAPVQTVQFSKETLEGFEEYLRYLYNYLKDFDYQDAQKRYAAEAGFDKSWLCGKATYPGELKADGVTPHWYCPYKFPFDYYAVVDEEGNNVRTAFTIDKLRPVAGETFVKKPYAGCKFWQKKLDF